MSAGDTSGRCGARLASAAASITGAALCGEHRPVLPPAVLLWGRIASSGQDSTTSEVSTTTGVCATASDERAGLNARAV
jgi:hypothetical protein